MVGSMERYFTRARAWPSFSSGTGDSTSCKSPGASNPFGRDCSRSWRLVTDTSEGNIFVGDFGAATQHAEVIGHDFKTGALLAFLVLPFAGLDAALDEDQRTLLEILLSDFGLFAPHDDLVPLGALLALTVFVFVRFVGGERKICDRLAAAGVARFGIAAQTADENHLI